MINVDDIQTTRKGGEFQPNKLPSRFQVGDMVNLNFYNAGTISDCEICNIHFNGSKVFYDVKVTAMKNVPASENYPAHNVETYINDIDSAFVDSQASVIMKSE